MLANEIDRFKKIRVIYNNNQGESDQTGIPGMPELVKLTTYTKEISRNDTFFFLAEGKDISLESFTQYKFCFLSLNKPQVEDLGLQNLKIESRNYVGFFVNKKVDGIVFQSFKDDHAPYQETYRPIFVAANLSKINSKTKHENRERRIEKYKQKFDFKLALNHFELAIEHNLYFGMFDILLAMEDKPNILAHFYLHYYQHCIDQKRTVDYKALHRFAEEMLFDWMLIPRKIWAEVIGKEEGKMNWVTDLFKNKKTSNGLEQYALSQCSEKYWSSSLNAPNQNNEIYTNIKRARKVECFFIQKPEVKIQVLLALDNTEGMYVSLLEILQK